MLAVVKASDLIQVPSLISERDSFITCVLHIETHL